VMLHLVDLASVFCFCPFSLCGFVCFVRRVT
jgi:hypothetical protein